MTTAETTTVRVRQGSQPHFGDLRVGVMRVGEHQGRRKARLWLNAPDAHERVDLAEGGTHHLDGHGTLVLEEVHGVDGPGGQRGEVTLSLRPDA